MKDFGQFLINGKIVPLPQHIFMYDKLTSKFCDIKSLQTDRSVIAEDSEQNINS